MIEKKPLKDIELKLIYELMKNSRRSDRELSRAVGVSQPTVNRTIRKLEKEGYLGQYTLLPNFAKLGYKILAITLVKLKKTITPEEREKARKLAMKILREGPFEIVMGERGIGMGYDGVFMSYHEDFASYARLKEWFRQFEFLEVGATENFLIDLEDKIHYHPLSFVPLTRKLIQEREKKE